MKKLIWGRVRTLPEEIWDYLDAPVRNVEPTARTWVTATEYARREGIQLNYIYCLIRTGRLPAEKVNGEWRIPLGATRRKAKPVPMPVQQGEFMAIGDGNGHWKRVPIK